jgi:catalase
VTISPQQAVDQVNSVFGSHAGYRALHAKGTVAKGTFTPTAEGAELTRAAHLHGGSLPVTVRFSNAAGDPGHGDFLPDPRGFAIKIYLPDGQRTDVVAVSSPHLPTRTPDEFIGLIKAQGPGPRPGLGMLRFLLTHPGVLKKLPSLAPTLAPRASFAGITYYGIHAFKWIDAAGTARYVRYTLEPAFDAPKLGPRQAKRLGPDYLHNELGERFARGPVTFKLVVTIAEPGDPTDDPTAVWPSERRRVHAATIEVEMIDHTRDTGDDVLVFDPTRVIDGIELSDDPVLRFRSAAYTESVKRRMASRGL